MTRAELEAALAWADWLARSKDPGPTLAMAKVSAPTLAAAVRELREENARLRAHLSGSPLDQALNEGDGSYKP